VLFNLHTGARTPFPRGQARHDPTFADVSWTNRGVGRSPKCDRTRGCASITPTRIVMRVAWSRPRSSRQKPFDASRGMDARMGHVLTKAVSTGGDFSLIAFELSSSAISRAQGAKLRSPSGRCVTAGTSSRSPSVGRPRFARVLKRHGIAEANPGQGRILYALLARG
jgi:hypothetical protein